MKLSSGLKDNGFVVGNTFNKYDSKNPIVQWIMKGFNDSLIDFIIKTSPHSIHEIGCGEGYWVIRLNRESYVSRGSDFSEKVIEIAKQNAVENKLSTEIFRQRDIYDMNYKDDSAELILCCEVLEHLQNPQKAFQSLRRIVKKYLILSVPREPIWRLLNFMRGKYLSEFGNTPGHIQHWSRYSFIKIVSRYFNIIEVKSPFPWTMLLCQNRNIIESKIH